MDNFSVAEIDVVKYYIKCEIGRVVNIGRQTEDFVRDFDRAIDEFPPNESILLMKALTGRDYRNNPLHDKLGNDEYSWKLERIRCNLVELSEINLKVNPILKQFDFNLARFVEHLRSEGRLDSDLGEFLDGGRKIWYSVVIGIRKANVVKLLDGSHRAVILAIRDNREIQCYVGYGKDA